MPPYAYTANCNKKRKVLVHGNSLIAYLLVVIDKQHIQLNKQVV